MKDLKQKKYYQTALSQRELEVLIKISHGMTTLEVAAKLFLSHHTVISHRKSLLIKLEALNTAHLIRIAFQLRILTPEVHSDKIFSIPITLIKEQSLQTV